MFVYFDAFRPEHASLKSVASCISITIFLIQKQTNSVTAILI